MRIRSPKDFWSGLCFIAIAAAFMALATRYRFGTAEKMGPGFFPIMVGILQAGLGAILLGRSFVLAGPPVERGRLPPLAITVAVGTCSSDSSAYSFGLENETGRLVRATRSQTPLW